MSRTVTLALAALVVAACTDSLSLRCPATSTPAGTFTLTLNLQHTADECLVVRQADGGAAPADGSIVPAVQSVNSALCAAVTDAGPALYLVVANSALVRNSSVDGDGGFTFVSPTLAGAETTLCNCKADVNETINGTLVGAGDGGFTVVADAGLVPQPTELSGSVVHSLKANPADGGCLCDMPCAEHYTLTGTANR
jgi:hypothetical protein